MSLQNLGNGPSPSNNVAAIILRQKARRVRECTGLTRASRRCERVSAGKGLIGVFNYFCHFQSLIWFFAKSSSLLSILTRPWVIDSRNPSRATQRSICTSNPGLPTRAVAFTLAVHHIRSMQRGADVRMPGLFRLTINEV
jgi:hypothetical protein